MGDPLRLYGLLVLLVGLACLLIPVAVVAAKPLPTSGRSESSKRSRNCTAKLGSALKRMKRMSQPPSSTATCPREEHRILS